jgi:two-component system copper resistance phosphate regulon response regulator CusR
LKQNPFDTVFVPAQIEDIFEIFQKSLAGKCTFMSYRILVAEDEPGLKQQLCDILNSAEYAADSTKDGYSALEAAATGRYDLLILEAMLPLFSGWDVVRKLRQAGQKIPVIMVVSCISGSQYANEGDLTETCIAKPFAADTLLGEVRHLLNAARPF